MPEKSAISKIFGSHQKELNTKEKSIVFHVNGELCKGKYNLYKHLNIKHNLYPLLENSKTIQFKCYFIL
jgi:hypothetical protein